MQTLKKKRSGAQQARRKLQRASACIETCEVEHEVMAAFNEIDRVRKKRSGNMKLRKRGGEQIRCTIATFADLSSRSRADESFV